MENRYPFGDGSQTPLYLTSGACEATHDYIYDLLKAKNLPFNEGEFLYPLTESEEKYIGESLADVADGFGALLGYSSLYQDRKYLAPNIELYFGEDSDISADDALQFGKALKEELAPKISAIGGHVFLTEHDEDDRHLMEILIPFEYAAKAARNFDEWIAHLENDLLATDLKARTALQP